MARALIGELWDEEAPPDILGSVNPSAGRHTRRVAGLLIPAVLLFGLGSSLEIFHPVEESALRVDPLHVVDESRDAIHAHALPAFDHDHHVCAHAHAVACVGGLRTAFEAAAAFGAPVAESMDRPSTSVLTVFDRGPPILL